MNDTEMKMEILLEDEIPERILAPIRAARSFFGHANSATYLKLLSEETTLANLSKKKLELQLSLAHFNPLLPNSNIFQENGNEIVKKNDYWEFPLLE
jgi:hypothetical protein